MADERSFGVRANVFVLRFARNWLRVALTVLAIYVALPFAAPTLMKLGQPQLASVIYTLYGPFCHQFAFRSLFLYGEQPVYPRAAAGTGWQPYEAYIRESPAFPAAVEMANGFLRQNRPPAALDLDGFSPTFQFASRFFLGDEQMGYKMTLCARDISIYFMMLVGGLIYSMPAVRRRLRPVPILLYVLLGLGPIAIDGFSQLLSYPPFSLWQTRETTPLFRIVTGGVFGFMNAWLAFPYLEQSFQETRQTIEDKLHAAGIPVR